MPVAADGGIVMAVGIAVAAADMEDLGVDVGTTVAPPLLVAAQVVLRVPVQLAYPLNLRSRRPEAAVAEVKDPLNSVAAPPPLEM
jgi:hypothetical protein